MQGQQIAREIWHTFIDNFKHGTKYIPYQNRKEVSKMYIMIAPLLVLLVLTLGIGGTEIIKKYRERLELKWRIDYENRKYNQNNAIDPRRKYGDEKTIQELESLIKLSKNILFPKKTSRLWEIKAVKLKYQELKQPTSTIEKTMTIDQLYFSKNILWARGLSLNDIENVVFLEEYDQTNATIQELLKSYEITT